MPKAKRKVLLSFFCLFIVTVTKELQYIKESRAIFHFLFFDCMIYRLIDFF